MVPIIYAFEEHINVLYSQVKADVSGKGIFKGFAYEWRNENVFHVYSQFPTVPPTGFPSMCFFSFLKPSEDIMNASNSIENLVSGYYDNKSQFAGSIVIVFFKFDGSSLAKRCFVKSERGIVEGKLHYIPAKSDLYSRSKGLLEVDTLSKKKIALVGLGSFGSTIAIEMAKAGIGNFKLFDFDRIELSNIARHTCGVNDLGRLKTHAIRDSILLKNPFANVSTYEININDDLDIYEKAIQDADLVLCLTDENRSRSNINEISLKQKKVTIFGRAITRAEGGDVFRLRPESGSPCLGCLLGKGLFNYKNEEISTLKQAGRDAPAYVSPEDQEAIVQVGLSSDIAPITNMMVKLSLVELSRGLNSGISSLEEDLVADYYIWANRRDKHYANWSKFEYQFNKPSILRWYGARITKNEKCMVCNTENYLI